MYNLPENLKKYYAELNPSARLEILEQLPENEEKNFLRTLYNERYSDHEHKGRKNVDWWLWRCICLIQLYNRGGFFKNFLRNETEKISRELFFTDNYETHRKFFYHEYRNTARRYLSTCDSPNYASSFMGFHRASDEQKIRRACKEIWEMSAGIARKVNALEKFSLWCEALRDELSEYAPICREEYNKLNS